MSTHNLLNNKLSFQNKELRQFYAFTNRFKMFSLIVNYHSFNIVNYYVIIVIF